MYCISGWEMLVTSQWLEWPQKCLCREGKEWANNTGRTTAHGRKGAVYDRGLCTGLQVSSFLKLNNTARRKSLWNIKLENKHSHWKPQEDNRLNRKALLPVLSPLLNAACLSFPVPQMPSHIEEVVGNASLDSVNAPTCQSGRQRGDKVSEGSLFSPAMLLPTWWCKLSALRSLEGKPGHKGGQWRLDSNQ